jgi:hypothetical protein
LRQTIMVDGRHRTRIRQTQLRPQTDTGISTAASLPRQLLKPIRGDLDHGPFPRRCATDRHVALPPRTEIC